MNGLVATLAFFVLVTTVRGDVGAHEYGTSSDKKLLAGILLVAGVYVAMRIFRRPPPTDRES